MVGMMLEDMLQNVGSNLDLAFSIEKALGSVRLHRLIMSIHGQKTISVAEELANRSVLFLLVTATPPAKTLKCGSPRLPRSPRQSHQNSMVGQSA